MMKKNSFSFLVLKAIFFKDDTDQFFSIPLVVDFHVCTIVYLSCYPLFIFQIVSFF